MNRNQIIEIINQCEPTFLDSARKSGYICPVCGSGSGTNGTGLTLGKDKKHYHCFACGLHADVIELYGRAYGINDFNSMLSAAAAYFGISADDPLPEVRKKKNAALQDAPEIDLSDFFSKAHADINKTDYHRGLSQATLDQFNIGYVANWRHPKSPNAPGSPRLIIPTSKYSYVARDTRQPKDIPEQQKQYTKSKVGKVRFLNLDAIYNLHPVFVVEGEIDALSIIDIGFPAMATGSAAYIPKFAARLKSKRPKAPFILCPDNDKPGQEAMQKLSDELSKLQIFHIIENISDECKDANELFLKDRSRLADNLTKAYERLIECEPKPDKLQDILKALKIFF